MLIDYIQLDLFKELGLEGLPEDQKKELEEKILEVVSGRINDALFTRLSEEDKKELDTILDQDKDPMEFFSQKIPGVEMIITEIIADFKKEMIDLYTVTTDELKESHGSKI